MFVFSRDLLAQYIGMKFLLLKCPRKLDQISPQRFSIFHLNKCINFCFFYFGLVTKILNLKIRNKHENRITQFYQKAQISCSQKKHVDMDQLFCFLKQTYFFQIFSRRQTLHFPRIYLFVSTTLAFFQGVTFANQQIQVFTDIFS